jgi:hypothetical protein
LEEHRGVRNIVNLPPLTIEWILEQADAHHRRTGEWPKKNSGKLADTDETWSRIQSALDCGNRGLPGGSSLARLLKEHRGVQNKKVALTIEWILDRADAHHKRTGEWPNLNSGKLEGTDETWGGIQGALCAGNRGLPGGSSLAKLIREHLRERKEKAAK